MSYLVLHIDVEFIVGTVCTDNGNFYPVPNGNDDLLWLYFFNNPHHNSISFGKENKAHFNDKEINYYGNFFQLIENENETFTIRGIQKKSIELLEYSGLVNVLKETYQSTTHETPNEIPTLITFSRSISELAKQKIVEYLRSQGFKIDSYTIPLSELVCYYPFSKKEFVPANGNVILLLAATNTSLHLKKLIFSDNYFMIDSEVKTYKGRGIDPRKQALIKFVVNELNNAVGALSSNDEKDDECERIESKADGWLKCIDAQLQNRPYRIIENLSKMPNAKKEVFVRKDYIESDTGHYIQELMDIFDAYKNDNVSGDIAAIFLLGDCFQNSLVKARFDKLIDKDKLFLFTNKDIQQILSIYPKIDFKRYIDQESRIKTLAEAEGQKQAEQRALEDKRRKEADSEAKRLAEAQKTELNKREAQKLFERAIEQEKEGQLDDARVNVENALSLDNSNREYRQFAGDLIEKIERLTTKNDLYKSFLNKADVFVESNELEKALEAYEAAQQVFDNAEIIKKIVEVKRLRREAEELKEKLSQLIADAQYLISVQHFTQARDKANEILAIDKNNLAAKFLLSEIEQAIELQSIELREKENNTKCVAILIIADNLFNDNDWAGAQVQYEKAKRLCPQEISIGQKIKQCKDKIQTQEDLLKELLFEATVQEKKGDLKQVLVTLKLAEKIQPDNSDIKKKINEIKFKLDFGSDNEPKTPIATPPPFIPPIATPPAIKDDFLKKESVKEEREEIFVTPAAKTKTIVIIYCTNCGAKLEVQDQFCFICGWKKKNDK